MSVPVWVARRSVAAALPLPSSVPNLVLWLDASDLSTISISGSAAVAPTATGQIIEQWTSKVLMPTSTTPRSFNFTRLTGTPLFQLSASAQHAIQFLSRVQNNNDCMRTSGGTPHPPFVASLPAGTAQGSTTIHVVKRVSTTQSQGFGLNVIVSTPNNTHRWVYNSTSAWGVAVATGTPAATTLSTINQTAAPNLQRAILSTGMDYIEVTLNYSTNQLITSIGIDNTVKKSTAVTAQVWTSANSYFIGGRYNSFGCDIGEILQWNRTLTDAELTTVKNYLKAKWGL